MNVEEANAGVAVARPAAQTGLVSRVAFGVGDFGFLLVWQGTTLFLMYFYTDVLGIAPAVAGAIYLAAMIWDAVTDPVIATFADRTRTSMGKYRPWLLFGALPFAASYPLAFSSPPIPGMSTVVWALTTHLFLRTAYTIVGMPFTSLQARLTSDANERAVLAGFRMVGAASGGLAIVFLTPSIVGAFGTDNEAAGYFYTAVVAGGLAFAGLLFCFFALREPPLTDVAPPTGNFIQEVGEMFRMMQTNGPLIRVFLIIVTGSICLGMFGKNVLYHFKYAVERPDLIILALTLPAMLLLIMTPVWVTVARRTSKRFALTVGLAIALTGYLAFFVIPAKMVSLAMAAITLIGVGGAALPIMYWSMLPDTIEYGEAKTGVRAEARTFGFAAFAQKAAVGANAGLLGLLLGVAGFEANAVQSDETLLSIKSIMALLPAIGVVLILFVLRGYRLDSAAHAQLVADIKSNEAKARPAVGVSG